MITKIAIENVKGFGSPAQELDVQLVPGRPNIVVAPNGFGKSSITRAFDCLTQEGIRLEETDFHIGNQNAKPRLMLEYNGSQYVTDETRNDIYSIFQCFCINNPLKATSVTQRIGGAFNHTKNSLDIEQVVLPVKVPIVASLSYSSREYKDIFGYNGKLLPNINDDLSRLVMFPFAEMDGFSGTRKKAKVNKIVEVLNSMEGSVEYMTNSVDDELFSELEALPEYQVISDCIIETFCCSAKLDVFLRFWILWNIYFSDKKNFKQTVVRNSFNAFVENLNKSFNALDTTWVGVNVVEDNRQLVVRFPKAGNISYGQRDSLYLFASLERIKSEIDRTRPVILIVDELFDYLDSVNMTIIQYFFSEFIKHCKSFVEIYPVIFTHLSPEYYHNYTFSKMNVQYLGFSEGVSDTPTRRLLKERGKEGSPIYEDASKYLLHYHPDTINAETTFESLGLRKKWGVGHGFAEYMVEECNKYFTNQAFDYYAITTAVRVRVEKLVYEQLPSEEIKSLFLNKNGTQNKFQYAEESGVDIPDIYSLLGIIYNDAEHLPIKTNSDKPIIYRLNNPTIKHIIQKLFDNNNPVTINHLI